jgi:hypothetical protein
MSRTFTEYGLSSAEFGGLVLEDPALFDSFVIRMVEDLDLSVHVTAGNQGLSSVSGSVPDDSFKSLDNVNRQSGKEFTNLASPQLGINAPTEFRSTIQPIVRTYVRGPLTYDPSSLDRLTDVVTAVAYDVLSTGAQQARAEGAQTVKLRHWLPGCEHWPYPLNRFC